MVAVLEPVEEEAVLADLAANGQITAGRLIVISVEAIRDRVGERWPMRRPAVWEFVQREFRRLFNAADQLVRLNDCWYLLVQPNQPTPAFAQGRAINILRNILYFFLGQNALPDLSVGRVVGIRDGKVMQEPLTAEDVKLAERAVPRVESGRKTEDGEVAPAPSPSAPRVFVVRFASHPIWLRRKSAVTSHRLKREVFERTERGLLLRPVDIARASTRDLIAIDLIVLEEAISLMASAAPNAKFGLHAPVHISTMNATEGREAVFARLSAAPEDDRKRLAISLDGLVDTPEVVLAAAVAALQPFVFEVAAQAPHLEFDVTAWRGARLSAISYDLETLRPTEDYNLLDALGRFAIGAESAADALIAHGVSTRAEEMAAWGSGFTGFSGDLLGDAIDVLRPTRLDAPNLHQMAGNGG